MRKSDGGGLRRRRGERRRAARVARREGGILRARSTFFPPHPLCYASLHRLPTATSTDRFFSGRKMREISSVQRRAESKRNAPTTYPPHCSSSCLALLRPPPPPLLPQTCDRFDGCVLRPAWPKAKTRYRPYGRDCSFHSTSAVHTRSEEKRGKSEAPLSSATTTPDAANLRLALSPISYNTATCSCAAPWDGMGCATASAKDATSRASHRCSRPPARFCLPAVVLLSEHPHLRRAHKGRQSRGARRSGHAQTVWFITMSAIPSDGAARGRGSLGPGDLRFYKTTEKRGHACTDSAQTTAAFGQFS
jgi:hypothetical protein